jgi:hypothetical protein
VNVRLVWSAIADRFRVLTPALLAVAMAAPMAVAEGPVVRFKKTQLDPIFRSEGVAVADLNGDGKKDIVAGQVWYAAPDWKMHPIVESKDVKEYDPRGYSNYFCTFAEDFDGDGHIDVMNVDFPGTPTYWHKNPGAEGKPWARYVVTPVTNNESPQFIDVNGDGKRDLLCAFAPTSEASDGPDKQMGYLTRTSDPTAPWKLNPVSEKNSPGSNRYSHGLGLGDLDGDKKLDILCDAGWWTAPASDDGKPWKFTSYGFGAGANYQVFDYDGDGDADVITTSPHAFGIWWHEQTAPGQFKQHEIDKSFSQTHATWQTDVNGDGLPDLVTGKRWKAHFTGDPGGDDPPVLCWLELKRENGRPTWTTHQFDHDSGIGTQFEMADVNGDGLIDVVSSNKKGVHFFQQVRE